MSQKLSDLYNKTSELTESTPEQVQAVVEEFWYAIRQQISKTEANDILIHGLGSLLIPKNMIDKYIETFKKSYTYGHFSERKYIKGLERLNRIKELLEQKNVNEL